MCAVPYISIFNVLTRQPLMVLVADGNVSWCSSRRWAPSTVQDARGFDEEEQCMVGRYITYWPYSQYFQDFNGIGCQDYT